MRDIRKRLDSVEKRLHIGEKAHVISWFPDDNGVEKKIEVGADEHGEFVKRFQDWLREIDGSGIRSPFEQLKGICRTNGKSVCAP